MALWGMYFVGSGYEQVSEKARSAYPGLFSRLRRQKKENVLRYHEIILEQA